jgi:hypothetical protein
VTAEFDAAAVFDNDYLYAGFSAVDVFDGSGADLTDASPRMVVRARA